MNPLNAVALLCLIYLATPAQGLKCHSCHGPGCQDPFVTVGSANFELECSPSIARQAVSSVKGAINDFASSLGISTDNLNTPDVKLVCAKVEKKNNDDSIVITRSCAIQSDKVDFCEITKKADSGIESCSICEEDLCNGGSVTKLSLGLMAASAVILMSLLH